MLTPIINFFAEKVLEVESASLLKGVSNVKIKEDILARYLNLDAGLSGIVGHIEFHWGSLMADVDDICVLVHERRPEVGMKNGAMDVTQKILQTNAEMIAKSVENLLGRKESFDKTLAMKILMKCGVRVNNVHVAAQFEESDGSLTTIGLVIKKFELLLCESDKNITLSDLFVYCDRNSEKIVYSDKDVFMRTMKNVDPSVHYCILKPLSLHIPVSTERGIAITVNIPRIDVGVETEQYHTILRGLGSLDVVSKRTDNGTADARGTGGFSQNDEIHYIKKFKEFIGKPSKDISKYENGKSLRSIFALRARATLEYIVENIQKTKKETKKISFRRHFSRRHKNSEEDEELEKEIEEISRQVVIDESGIFMRVNFRIDNIHVWIGNRENKSVLDVNKINGEFILNHFTKVVDGKRVPISFSLPLGIEGIVLRNVFGPTESQIFGITQTSANIAFDEKNNRIAFNPGNISVCAEESTISNMLQSLAPPADFSFNAISKFFSAWLSAFVAPELEDFLMAWPNLDRESLLKIFPPNEKLSQFLDRFDLSCQLPEVSVVLSSPEAEFSTGLSRLRVEHKPKEKMIIECVGINLRDRKDEKNVLEPINVCAGIDIKEGGVLGMCVDIPQALKVVVNSDTVNNASKLVMPFLRTLLAFVSQFIPEKKEEDESSTAFFDIQMNMKRGISVLWDSEQVNVLFVIDSVGCAVVSGLNGVSATIEPNGIALHINGENKLSLLGETFLRVSQSVTKKTSIVARLPDIFCDVPLENVKTIYDVVKGLWVVSNIDTGISNLIARLNGGPEQSAVNIPELNISLAALSARIHEENNAFNMGLSGFDVHFDISSIEQTVVRLHHVAVVYETCESLYRVTNAPHGKREWTIIELGDKRTDFLYVAPEETGTMQVRIKGIMVDSSLVCEALQFVGRTVFSFVPPQPQMEATEASPAQPLPKEILSLKDKSFAIVVSLEDVSAYLREGVSENSVCVKIERVETAGNITISDFMDSSKTIIDLPVVSVKNLHIIVNNRFELLSRSDLDVGLRLCNTEKMQFVYEPKKPKKVQKMDFTVTKENLSPFLRSIAYFATAVNSTRLWYESKGVVSGPYADKSNFYIVLPCILDRVSVAASFESNKAYVSVEGVSLQALLGSSRSGIKILVDRIGVDCGDNNILLEGNDKLVSMLLMNSQFQAKENLFMKIVFNPTREITIPTNMLNDVVGLLDILSGLPLFSDQPLFKLPKPMVNSLLLEIPHSMELTFGDIHASLKNVCVNACFPDIIVEDSQMKFAVRAQSITVSFKESVVAQLSVDCAYSLQDNKFDALANISDICIPGEALEFVASVVSELPAIRMPKAMKTFPLLDIPEDMQKPHHQFRIPQIQLSTTEFTAKVLDRDSAISVRVLPITGTSPDKHSCFIVFGVGDLRVSYKESTSDIKLGITGHIGVHTNSHGDIFIDANMPKVGLLLPLQAVRNIAGAVKMFDPLMALTMPTESVRNDIVPDRRGPIVHARFRLPGIDVRVGDSSEHMLNVVVSNVEAKICVGERAEISAGLERVRISLADAEQLLILRDGAKVCVDGYGMIEACVPDVSVSLDMHDLPDVFVFVEDMIVCLSDFITQTAPQTKAQKGNLPQVTANVSIPRITVDVSSKSAVVPSIASIEIGVNGGVKINVEGISGTGIADLRKCAIGGECCVVQMDQPLRVAATPGEKTGIVAHVPVTHVSVNMSCLGACVSVVMQELQPLQAELKKVVPPSICTDSKPQHIDENVLRTIALESFALSFKSSIHRIVHGIKESPFTAQIDAPEISVSAHNFAQSLLTFGASNISASLNSSDVADVSLYVNANVAGTDVLLPTQITGRILVDEEIRCNVSMPKPLLIYVPLESTIPLLSAIAGIMTELKGEKFAAKRLAVAEQMEISVKCSDSTFPGIRIEPAEHGSKYISLEYDGSKTEMFVPNLLRGRKIVRFLNPAGTHVRSAVVRFDCQGNTLLVDSTVSFSNKSTMNISLIAGSVCVSNICANETRQVSFTNQEIGSLMLLLECEDHGKYVSDDPISLTSTEAKYVFLHSVDRPEEKRVLLAIMEHDILSIAGRKTERVSFASESTYSLKIIPFMRAKNALCYDIVLNIFGQNISVPKHSEAQICAGGDATTIEECCFSVILSGKESDKMRTSLLLDQRDAQDKPVIWSKMAQMTWINASMEFDSNSGWCLSIYPLYVIRSPIKFSYIVGKKLNSHAPSETQDKYICGPRTESTPPLTEISLRKDDSMCRLDMQSFGFQQLSLRDGVMNVVVEPHETISGATRISVMPTMIITNKTSRPMKMLWRDCPEIASGKSRQMYQKVGANHMARVLFDGYHESKAIPLTKTDIHEIMIEPKSASHALFIRVVVELIHGTIVQVSVLDGIQWNYFVLRNFSDQTLEYCFKTNANNVVYTLAPNLQVHVGWPDKAQESVRVHGQDVNISGERCTGRITTKSGNTIDWFSMEENGRPVVTFKHAERTTDYSEEQSISEAVVADVTLSGVTCMLTDNSAAKLSFDVGRIKLCAKKELSMVDFDLDLSDLTVWNIEDDATSNTILHVEGKKSLLHVRGKSPLCKTQAIVNELKLSFAEVLSVTLSDAFLLFALHLVVDTVKLFDNEAAQAILASMSGQKSTAPVKQTIGIRSPVELRIDNSIDIGQLDIRFNMSSVTTDQLKREEAKFTVAIACTRAFLNAFSGISVTFPQQSIPDGFYPDVSKPIKEVLSRYKQQALTSARTFNGGHTITQIALNRVSRFGLWVATMLDRPQTETK